MTTVLRGSDNFNTSAGGMSTLIVTELSGE